MQVQSLGQEDPLEERMTTHSSILAWRMPWIEQSGGLQSTGWQRVRQCDSWGHKVGHDWATELNWTMSQFSQFSSVTQSCPSHELQYARPPCPSLTPRVHSNSCPSSWWCHPAISSSVIPFSSCPQSLPASGSFPMSQLFTWGGQSIGVPVLASVLPMNTQDWYPLEWTGWISLQSKGFSI